MKRRILFVGMNNKPDTPPLSSLTKSGRVIDKLIAELPQYDCVKSNLFDLEYWPDNMGFTSSGWEHRVSYESTDIVITLGDKVRREFVGSGIRSIAMGHPASLFGQVNTDDYVLTALIRIEAYLKRNP